ncbi:MAG: fused MFS/spermidine synthase [Pseudomonadales bacterium]|jgi:spermidine synthase|nr:fused MFS/spermidine synthase [Pseudomonadales bacterium]
MFRSLFAFALASLSLGLLAPAAQAQSGVLRTVHQERSLYRNILVTEDDERRCMRFTITDLNGQNQSCRFYDDHDKLVFPYAKMVLASLMVQERPTRILIVGLGGGTLVHTYSTLFPEANITIAEIDEAVVGVAKQFFDYQETPLIHSETVDARVFVKRQGLRGAQYDLVILDAFNGEYIPEHLMTAEFLEEVKKLLPETGMVVANTFSTSRLYSAESNTYRQVFGEIFNVRMEGTGNRIIIASQQPLPDRATLESRVSALQARVARFDMDMSEFPALLNKNADWDLRERVLTDQYAPANLLNN